MHDLTAEQALAEARRRWGARAVVCKTVTLGLDADAAIVAFYVGERAHDSHNWRELGRGRSWKTAFDSAGPA